MFLCLSPFIHEHDLLCLQAFVFKWNPRFILFFFTILLVFGSELKNIFIFLSIELDESFDLGLFLLILEAACSQ